MTLHTQIKPALDRLERSTWDSRVIPQPQDVRALLDIQVQLADLLSRICRMQEAFEGDAITTHVRLMRICREARPSLAAAQVPA